MPRPSARFSTSSASLLTADDHWARAVHLMMHDRASATERLFGFLTEGQKSLARRAQRDVARAPRTPRRCSMRSPDEWQDHPIYIYTRVQRARAGRALCERRRLARQGDGRRARRRRVVVRAPGAHPQAARGGRAEARVPRGRRLHRRPRWPRGRGALPRRLDRALLPRRRGDGGDALRRDDGALDAAGVGGAGELLAWPRPARAWQGRGREGGLHGRRRLPDDLLRPALARRPSGSPAPTSAACPTRPAARPRSRRSR